MNRRYLSFIALAVSILYGAGFAIFTPVSTGYAVGGGAVVALLWISVGVFGKDEPAPGQAAAQPPSDAPPFGTPPEDQK